MSSHDGSCSKLLVIGRCKGNHKNGCYQCELVKDTIQQKFNRQYWSFKKAEQDSCLMSSIKVTCKDESTGLDALEYRYFIYGYEVCRTLGFKTRSRIEYLFRKLKRTNGINSLEHPIDGRKSNRVKSRAHNEKFLNDLYKFIESFEPIKIRNRLLIENHKPMDLYRKWLEKSNYELIYEKNNVKLVKKNVQAVSNDQCSSTNHHDHRIQVNNDLYDDASMGLTNGPVLLINETSNSASNMCCSQEQLTAFSQTSNQSIINNFNQFNQNLNANSNLSANSNVNSELNSDDHQSNEMCSYSYFLRFLKKHKFEFRKG